MNDDFEQRLREQKLRQIPREWREDILRTAHRAAQPRDASLITHHSLSTLGARLSAFLWPNPCAWAGLAAVWLVILAMNLAIRDSVPAAQAKVQVPPSTATLLILKEQRQLLAELNGALEKREGERPPVSPSRPRSERRERMVAV
jgi:hypothetical protein